MAGDSVNGTNLNNTGPLGRQCVVSMGSASYTYVKSHTFSADDRRAVAPDELAHFVDVEVGEKSCLQESWFQEDAEGRDAFIFVTMVVAHIAHFAYVAAGQEKQMSESIAEAGWNLIDTLIEYGRNEGLLFSGLPRLESGSYLS